MEIVEIDGSMGGGSVLRVAAPLAIALGKSLRVTNVRSQKANRGIQVQHLVGLEFLAQITGSQLIGAAVGSSEIFLTPGNSTPPTDFLPIITVPTSAAVSLIIQTLSNYVFASRKPIGFEFNGGGTHVSFSPNFDVLLHVNKPLFELFGLRLHIQLFRPGFYPQGGAAGRVFLEPVPFSRVELISGEVDRIDVISSAASGLREQRVAERQIVGFKSVIPKINSTAGYADAHSQGASCTAVIKYKGNSVKGVARISQSDVSPEELGRQTAKMAQKEVQNPASVDEQLADQLILPLAFSPPGSTYTYDKTHPHVRVNSVVVNDFLGSVLTVQQKDGVFHISKK